MNNEQDPQPADFRQEAALISGASASQLRAALIGFDAAEKAKAAAATALRAQQIPEPAPNPPMQDSYAELSMPAMLPDPGPQLIEQGVGTPTAVQIKGFQLVDATVGGVTKVRIYASNFGPCAPTGFNPGDSPPNIFDVTGMGVVYFKVTYYTDSGSVSDIELFTTGSTVPVDDPADGIQYLQIGSYNTGTDMVTVSNTAFGPVVIQPCPVLYSSPQAYTLNFYPSS
jgi:hypothetical protein